MMIRCLRMLLLMAMTCKAVHFLLSSLLRCCSRAHIWAANPLDTAISKRLHTSWLLVSGDWKWWLCSHRRVAVCCSRTWVPNLMGVPRAQCLPCKQQHTSQSIASVEHEMAGSIILPERTDGSLGKALGDRKASVRFYLRRRLFWQGKSLTTTPLDP